MQYYSELAPPTAVTHSIYFPFISATSNNLIVAKTSLLQIFSVKSTTSHDAPSEDTNIRNDRSHTSKLVLVAEYPLSGTITSLARVKIMNSKSGGEALLISIKDAKLSLLQWDPEVHTISTISIHLYEREDLQGSPWGPDIGQSPSYLTVDPSSRCAALKFGQRNLAILPFHQPGDDLVMDDYDPELDGEQPNHDSPSKATIAESIDSETPYSSSFVLPISALDHSLRHPIHLAFLYEYREPTFGILYSTKSPSSGLLSERRDILSYAVFTLDLEQRASTMLLSVAGLPYDLDRVIPLPQPVGGTLLLGSNEIVHVDQAGKTNALGVNEFARACSSFSMADQSDLGMKLEGCVVEQLTADSGDMLIVSNNGNMAVLSFRIDGRSVSGLSIHQVTEENGGACLAAGASCSSLISRGRLFIGSEDMDSTIIGWNNPLLQLKRRKTNTEKANEEEESSDTEMDDLDEDDLYSAETDGVIETRRKSSVEDTAGGYKFRIHDTLPNLGPMEDVALGKPYQTSPDAILPSLELVATCGRERAGGLSVFQKEISPEISMKLNIKNVNGAWAIHGAKPAKALRNVNTNEGGTISKDENYDKYLVTSEITKAGEEESIVYKLGADGVKELKDTEFDPSAGATIDVGSLAGGTRLVQALKGEIRSYDSEFGLAQIFPMTDELTGAEPKVISTSFADPFMLVLRDDSSVIVLEADASGDLDEVDRGDGVLKTKWLSGCLYEDRSGMFIGEMDAGRNDRKNVLVFLLSAEGGLQVFHLPNLSSPIYRADGLSFLPPFLTPEYLPKRLQAKEILTELIVADLGDQTFKSPYLILRAATDDLVIYSPYRSPSPRGASSTAPKLSTGELRFLKVSNPQLAKPPGEAAVELPADPAGPDIKLDPLRVLPDLNGYSAVFLPGANPSFVLKDARTDLKVVGFRTAGGKAVKALSPFYGEKGRGFIFVDVEGVIRIANLPPNNLFTHSSLVTKRVRIGEQIRRLTYHAELQCYVLSTTKKSGFKLPNDDELHYEWRSEDISLLPQIPHGSLKVVNPRTWTVIQNYPLEPNEVALALHTLTLETSETNPNPQPLICVGTTHIRGLDLPTTGRILIFQLIQLVPDPSRPETDRGLKLLCSETVKGGGVSNISSVGTQGFLLVSVGLKIQVRGLKDDGSLLPVAFLDVMAATTILRELRTTGLVLLGDIRGGLWLVGYEEEPYRLRVLSKAPKSAGAAAQQQGPLGLEAIHGELVPVNGGKELQVVVADSEGDIRIWGFDPEDPKSVSGTRLLPLTTFHTGHYPGSMTLVPSTGPTSTTTIAPTTPLTPLNGMDTTPTEDDPSTKTPTTTPPTYSLLLTSPAGTLSLLTPLSEPLYRRLSALHSLLLPSLPHPASLNPRAYRAPAGGSGSGQGLGLAAGSGKAVVDGLVVDRWNEIGCVRKREIESRLGAEGGDVREDLRAVGVGGVLGFL
ncbi:MAG: mRNA cleavage and polyadenylation factor subunit [Cirrosporium novae-zelandiae]|nr:MAG: mRNA cleavage and polyadenylation factor subunit [Cirrosporium novae-zelandiae]